MIWVDRKAVTVPKDLDGDDSPGARERKKTLDFFADPQNLEKPYDKYAAYKAASVIQALEELFHGKCAYCESYYPHLQPVDVEHFRPKGGVAVEDPATGKVLLQRPGYYWLAAAWENLLPSCIDCNRERTHKFDDDDLGKSGKANKFPIHNKKRKMTPGCERREKRLLLDPCQDTPEDHLTFADDGSVEAANGSPEGKTSITVYGLGRDELRKRRRDLALEINAQIVRIHELLGLKRDYPQDPRFQRMLEQELGRLKGRLDSDQEYAGMARQLVRRQLGPVPIGG